jgi:hypothetical protein
MDDDSLSIGPRPVVADNAELKNKKERFPSFFEESLSVLGIIHSTAQNGVGRGVGLILK